MQGAEAIGHTPEEFHRQLREDVASWGEVVKLSGGVPTDWHGVADD